MDTIDLMNELKLKNIPYFNDRLKLVKDIDNVPFTTKGDLLDAQSKKPPYGDFLDSSCDIQQIYRTSGTTAEPLLLAFSHKDINLITNIGADCYSYAGMGQIGNDEIVINCLNLSMWAGGVLDSQSMLKTGVQVINFGTGNTTELIKLILKLKLTYKVSIHCTPSYLPVIRARLFDEFGMDSHQLGIWSFYLGAEGGLQNNEFRNKLQEEWRAKVYNSNYGMSEVCSIMASANDENILRFSPMYLESYINEVKMQDGNIKKLQDLTANEEGELVVSSLYKECQPVFRYATKENIRIIKNTDEGIFFEVIGRKDDMLVYKGINFFPEQLRGILSAIPELTGAYKVQAVKKGGIVKSLNLICEIKTEQPSDNEGLRDTIQKLIRNELTLSISVNFVYEIPLLGNKVKILDIVEEE